MQTNVIKYITCVILTKSMRRSILMLEAWYKNMAPMHILACQSINHFFETTRYIIWDVKVLKLLLWTDKNIHVRCKGPEAATMNRQGTSMWQLVFRKFFYVSIYCFSNSSFGWLKSSGFKFEFEINSIYTNPYIHTYTI